MRYTGYMKRFLPLIITVIIFGVGLLLNNKSTSHLLTAQDYRYEPLCQLQAYKKAGIYWPLLRFNEAYRDQLTDLKNIETNVNQAPAVTVYFKLDASEKDIESIISELESNTYIRSVEYITRDEAFNSYKDLNKDNPLLLEMVSPEVLPESLEIYVSDIREISSIQESLLQNPIVEEGLVKDELTADCNIN